MTAEIAPTIESLTAERDAAERAIAFLIEQNTAWQVKALTLAKLRRPNIDEMCQDASMRLTKHFGFQPIACGRWLILAEVLDASGERLIGVVGQIGTTPEEMVDILDRAYEMHGSGGDDI